MIYGGLNNRHGSDAKEGLSFKNVMDVWSEMSRQLN